jgi:hypothetical protein
MQAFKRLIILKSQTTQIKVALYSDSESSILTLEFRIPKSEPFEALTPPENIKS